MQRAVHTVWRALVVAFASLVPPTHDCAQQAHLATHWGSRSRPTVKPALMDIIVSWVERTP